MNYRGYGWFILQTIIAHVIFLYSIFDIYFTSPVLHGMPAHKANLGLPPAKRLVLFVTDGLRYDKCFEEDDSGVHMPYISSVISQEGVWRVSHTRVPTESRPGHVALIAGFYEDVSAVAKGWKENPVEFDSVFNRSHKTWGFGSPDIVLMFKRGQHVTNVETDTYPPEYEDFAGTDLSFLDSWVFNKVEKLFKNSEADPQLYEELHKDQIIIFLHLLGIDTNGHRHNPSSEQYKNNIKLVDEGIRMVVEQVNTYYNDNDTAFIMTSDHGMSEWGTHGSGHPHETLTPFVAWGSGIAREQIAVHTAREVETSSHILQADVAPFMAALLNLEFPVNNVGVLHPSLLNMPMKDQAELMYTNMLQIGEQFIVSLNNRQRTTFSWLFRAYPSLKLSGLQSNIRDIRQLIQAGHYSEAIELSSQTIQLALDGITYYHKYDRLYLGLCIAAGFLTWIVYSLCYLLEQQNAVSFSSNSSLLLSSIIWWLIRGAIATALLAQHLPWTHLLYALLPTLPLQYVCNRKMLLYSLVRQVYNSDEKMKFFLWSLLIIAGLEGIIYSFFHRQLLSLILIIITLVDHKNLYWVLSCLLLGVFPNLPVVGRGANYYLVLLCGAVFVLGLSQAANKSSMTFVQIFLLICANLDVFYTWHSVSEGQGLPLVCLIISWTIMCCTWLLPVCSSQANNKRLLVVNTAIFTLYLLLSTSYEAWFVLSLILFTYSWIYMELDRCGGTEMKDKPVTSLESHKALSVEDIRRSFIYLLSITIAFFGTGNIASINSFEPASVFCFMTVFSPFSMASLMILKIILPFVLVTCAFHVISSQLSVTNKKGVFLIILMMSDFMGLHFFMWVTDTGSWLDIGTSISHYVITLSTTIVLILLSELSKVLMDFIIWPRDDNSENKFK